MLTWALEESSPGARRKLFAMTALLLIGETAGFFAVAWLYVRGCERL